MIDARHKMRNIQKPDETFLRGGGGGGSFFLNQTSLPWEYFFAEVVESREKGILRNWIKKGLSTVF